MLGFSTKEEYGASILPKTWIVKNRRHDRLALEIFGELYL